jgi:toxin FitB
VSFLLDTNIISEVRKPNANPNVRAWFVKVGATALYLSVLVVGEIRQGIEHLRRRDPRQAEMFEAWLMVLLRDYRDRILPLTAEIADEWGRLNVPDAIPAVDGLMAATAKVHGLTLVTRNVADFERTNARLLDPFKPAG